MSKFNIMHCKIQTKIVGTQDSFFTKIKNKLESSLTVKDRTYQPSSFGDVHEGIIHFDIKTKHIFCVYASFKSGGKTIENSLFNEKLLPLETAVGADNKLHLDRYIYMLIEGDEIVMKTGFSQKHLSIYFNDILDIADKGTEKITIMQSIKEAIPEQNITFSDIKSWELTPTKHVDSDTVEITTKKKKLSKELFATIKKHGDFKDLQMLQDEDVVDIYLDIRIKHQRKPEKINKEMWEKHISHNPNLYTMVLRDGRKIKASVLELKKLIEIETHDNLYNEKDVYQQMVSFLKECRK